MVMACYPYNYITIACEVTGFTIFAVLYLLKDPELACLECV
jgi:hypothetical protein